MIDITEQAQAYFRDLIDKQGQGALNLRIQVENPGTPQASCDLQFSPEGENRPGDRHTSFEGFDLFVAPDSVAWLKTAEIDFEEDAAGGQLNIKAPNIKGNAPSEDAVLEKRIEWVLQSEINPQLASHGGRVALVSVTESVEVVLQFGGGCHGCGMADMTLKQGIETTLKKHFPEINGVLDVTDHESGANPYYKADA